MSKTDLIYLPTSTNKVEAIRQIVQITCILKFSEVTGRELDLLCELLRCGGVNEQAKKSFLVNYKTTKENYGQLVKRLADKGILYNNEKRNGKNLHKRFNSILDLYINNPVANHFVIKYEVN